jgi:hypothetical protein
MVGTALFASGAATAVTARTAGGIPHGETNVLPHSLRRCTKSPEAPSRIEPLNGQRCLSISNHRTTILPLLAGEGRGEGESLD